MYINNNNKIVTSFSLMRSNHAVEWELGSVTMENRLLLWW